MSSDADQTTYNTRERMLSTDLTRMTDLLQRWVMEGIAALGGETDNPLSGVIRGLKAVAPGTGMSVNLSAGIAMLYDSGVAYPDSKWRWIEQQSDTIVSIPASEAVLNRWDVIEIAPNASITSTESRDIYSATLGTFTPGSVTKEVASRPTISVRSGTPATNPALPAGTSGVIPLAYVYVPGAATVINPGDVVLCRPFIALRSTHPYGPYLGGNVEVASAGGNTIKPLPFRMDDDDGIARIGGGFTSVDMSASSYARVDASLTYPPASDTMCSIYVARPPYPTGYDSTMANREITTSGSRIPSYTSGFDNGIIILTDETPALPDDASGNWGAALVALNDPTWGSQTISGSDAMYLGSVLYDQSAGGLARQICTGAVVERPDSGTYPTEQYNVEAGGGSDTGDLRKTSPLTDAGSQIIPSTARRFGLTWWCTNVYGTSATNGDFALGIETDSAADDVALTIPNLAGLTDISDTTWVQAVDGAFDWSFSNSSQGARLTIYVKSFEDRVIAAR